jgi:hypothetical protein
VNHTAQATAAIRVLRATRAPLLVFAVFFFGGVAFSLAVNWVALAIYYFVDAFWLHRLGSPEILPTTLLLSVPILFSLTLIIQPLPQAIGAVVATAAFALIKYVPLRVVMIMVPVLGFLISKASWIDDNAATRAAALAWRDFLLFSALQLPVSLLCWLLTRRLLQRAAA